MWWVFFILFILISIVSSTLLFYSLKRINQYEEFIIQFQQIIQFSTERMKQVDSRGHYEADDETGFFFQQLKDIQLLLNDIFEQEIPNGSLNNNPQTTANTKTFFNTSVTSINHLFIFLMCFLIILS